MLYSVELRGQMNFEQGTGTVNVEFRAAKIKGFTSSAKRDLKKEI
jgi:hypothetical protein